MLKNKKLKNKNMIKKQNLKFGTQGEKWIEGKLQVQMKIFFDI